MKKNYFIKIKSKLTDYDDKVMKIEAENEEEALREAIIAHYFKVDESSCVSVMENKDRAERWVYEDPYLESEKWEKNEITEITKKSKISLPSGYKEMKFDEVKEKTIHEIITGPLYTLTEETWYKDGVFYKQKRVKIKPEVDEKEQDIDFVFKFIRKDDQALPRSYCDNHDSEYLFIRTKEGKNFIYGNILALLAEEVEDEFAKERKKSIIREKGSCFYFKPLGTRAEEARAEEEDLETLIADKVIADTMHLDILRISESSCPVSEIEKFLYYKESAHGIIRAYIDFDKLNSGDLTPETVDDEKRKEILEKIYHTLKEKGYEITIEIVDNLISILKYRNKMKAEEGDYKEKPQPISMRQLIKLVDFLKGDYL